MQIPVSAIKFAAWGISDKTMGTYGTGGGLTTIIPIMGLGYLAGFNVFHKPKKKYWVLATGFIFYGIAGAKAALFFLFPVTFTGLYYLTYNKKNISNLFKKVIFPISLILITLILCTLILKYNTRLNPDKRIGGKADFSYALKYSKDYTAAMKSSVPGAADGRYSTTMLVLKTILKDGFVRVFYGFGPGSLTQSVIKDNKRNIDDNIELYWISKSYGITSLTFLMCEYGIMASIFLLALFITLTIRCLKFYNTEKEPYWKAISVGNLTFSILILFIFCFYNNAPIESDTITPVYFYSMAVMHYRLYQSSLLSR